MDIIRRFVFSGWCVVVPFAILAVLPAIADRELALDYQSAYQLAVDELENGHFDSAKQQLEHLVAKLPSAPVPHYLMLTSCMSYEMRSLGLTGIDMRTYNTSVRHLHNLLKQKGDEALSDNDLVMVYYALGHYWKQLGDNTRAWNDVLKGSRFMYKAIPDLEYRVSQEMLAMQALPLTFTRGLVGELHQMLAPRAKLKSAKPTPVLVIGLPRSGSTLLEQVLAKHSKVVGGGESPVDLGGGTLEKVMLILMQAVPRLMGNGLEGDAFDKAMVALLNDTDVKVLKNYAEKYVTALRHKASELGATQGTRFITDKTLNNYLPLGLLAAMLPHAKIIYCARSGMDIGMSMFWHFFASHSQLYSYDLQTLGSYIALAQASIAHFKVALPGRIHTVAYEDMVADLPGTTSKVLTFLGLSWEDAVINFTDQSNVVRTASLGQVRQPLYNTSVGSWKKHKKWLGPLKEGLRKDRQVGDDEL